MVEKMNRDLFAEYSSLAQDEDSLLMDLAFFFSLFFFLDFFIYYLLFTYYYYF